MTSACPSSEAGLPSNRYFWEGGLLSAFSSMAPSGAWRGNRLLTKVTLRLVQLLVALMLLGIAAALGSGLL